MEYYSVLRRNELSNRERTREILKCVLASENVLYYVKAWEDYILCDSNSATF